jgi:hypothetical protein
MLVPNSSREDERGEKETQMQPHTRVNFIDNSNIWFKHIKFEKIESIVK